MENIIIASEKTLEQVFERVIEKRFPKSIQEEVEPTYSINQVAKMLRRSHKKISNLVISGVLKTTTDNRIYESSIKEYTRK